MNNRKEAEAAGWNFEYNPKPIPDFRFDWDFWHEEYCPDNGLCGNGASIEDCLAQINEIEAEAYTVEVRK